MISGTQQNKNKNNISYNLNKDSLNWIRLFQINGSLLS